MMFVRCGVRGLRSPRVQREARIDRTAGARAVIFIDNQQDFDAAMARVAAQPVVALDTEADSLHSYFDKVCLIQMSIPGEDLIIDPLCNFELTKFGEILANRGITKILHGADY